MNMLIYDIPPQDKFVHERKVKDDYSNGKEAIENVSSVFGSLSSTSAQVTFIIKLPPSRT